MWRPRLLTLFLFAACVQVNPSARYSCETQEDCGPGYECVPRFEGASQCWREGECVTDEVCNGADDNCDGRTDETFPEAGEACATTELGLCAAGERVCVTGQLACAQKLQPMPEQCDTADNDCDGTVDEDFDLTSDEANCGACGQTCDAGTVCLASSCDESVCDDGVDNDSDGLTDCADPACRGQVCDTATAPPARCGVLTFDAGLPPPQADGGGFDAGADWDGGALPGCFAPESRCDDGFDDDGDGEPDCLDLDCAGAVCASGNQCTNRSCPP